MFEILHQNAKAIKSGAGVPKGNFYKNVMSKTKFKDATGTPIKGTLMNRLRGYPKGVAPNFGKTTMYNAYDDPALEVLLGEMSCLLLRVSDFIIYVYFPSNLCLRGRVLLHVLVPRSCLS